MYIMVEISNDFMYNMVVQFCYIGFIDVKRLVNQNIFVKSK